MLVSIMRQAPGEALVAQVCRHQSAGMKVQATGVQAFEGHTMEAIKTALHAAGCSATTWRGALGRAWLRLAQCKPGVGGVTSSNKDSTQVPRLATQ